MKYVEVKHTFAVADEVTDEQIANIVGTMTVQVEEPVVGTDDDGNEETIDVGFIDVEHAVSSPLLVERKEGTYYLGPLEPAKAYLRDEYTRDGVCYIREEHIPGGYCDSHSGFHEFRNDPDPCIGWRDVKGPVRVGEYAHTKEGDSPNQWGTSMTGNWEEAWRWLLGTDFGPIDAEYDEANLRRLLLRYSVDFNNLEPDLKIFLEQNERIMSSVTPEDVDSMNENAFAEHHAGGLFVLGRHTDDGRYVKMHDSWGDDGRIVVHRYNPEGDESVENEWYYDNAHDAYFAFLHVEEAEVLAEESVTAELNGVKVTVTRSAGTDGAMVVFVDTQFEPNASDGGPGLRVLINDHDTYAGKPYGSRDE